MGGSPAVASSSSRGGGGGGGGCSANTSASANANANANANAATPVGNADTRANGTLYGSPASAIAAVSAASGVAKDGLGCATAGCTSPVYYVQVLHLATYS